MEDIALQKFNDFVLFTTVDLLEEKVNTYFERIGSDVKENTLYNEATIFNSDAAAYNFNRIMKKD